MSKEINQGIQGTNLNITAHAIAVGAGAQAVSMAREPADVAQLQEAIARLQAAVEQLNVAPAVREIVKEDVAQVAAAAQDPKVGKDRLEALLKGLAAKLGGFGIVLKEITSLAEPLKKIAEFAKVPLEALGIL